MLKEYLKKVFNPASAETQEEIISMTTEENQVAAMAADNITAELTAKLTTVTESLTTLQSQFAEMSTQYEAAKAALAQSAEAQEVLVANAKAAVMATRTASLTAVMGDVKGPLLAASLESLDDTTFATVLSGYAASFEAEANSEMFKEKGVAADAPPAVEVDAVQKMAEKFAAEFNPK